MSKFDEEPERLVESIAEGMWSLIRDTDQEKDWTWCCKNEPGVASELRCRARMAIARSSSLKNSSRSPEKLDLRFKDAFVSGDFK